MEKKIKVLLEYVVFQEEGKGVIYAPQISCALNGTTKKDLRNALKSVLILKIERWRQKNELKEKVKSLGLDATITSDERRVIDMKFSVPYHLLKTKHSMGILTIPVSVPLKEF